MTGDHNSDLAQRTLWQILRARGLPLDQAQWICNDAMLAGIIGEVEETLMPSDEQIAEVILAFARSRGPAINLTYEAGRYEITTPTGAAMNLARDILALSSAKRGDSNG